MILRAVAFALITVLVATLLGEMGYGGKRIVAVLAMLMLFISLSDGIGDIVRTVTGMAESAGVGNVAAVAIKVVGVGYLFGIVSEVCEELGERGIATAVVNVGRVEILVLIFPYLKEILEMGIGLIK